MFPFTRPPLLPGWIGCAPQGGHTALALVQPAATGGRPAVRWAVHEAWDGPASALRRLRGPHALARHRRVALLERGQYLCQSMDAPAEVGRADWAAAVRWQLKDSVDFAVDTAAIDVLAVPSGASYRPQPQLIAVAAAEQHVRPLITGAHDAGLPWSAVDVAETALRNLALLVQPEGRALALLHCQPSHATLVVTYAGELLSTRQMDLAAEQFVASDEAVRQRAFDHAGLELQRTLDGIERAYGQVTLAQLLITPMPGVAELAAHLGPLLYVPVAPLDLAEALDWTAVPELAADAAALNRVLLAIGAALRDD
ncbi:hypothetical protein [Aquabacterium sp. OR-4]|uniref:hypothetical protein n=1 Tax=Aquabacterium sp. OR-4 TaxID=2978127 RepID=UPI0021B49291|nr:hypothetical protein [Aquabacterium sp. OR-4]MDT7836880.1 hypothetical protein [Aquabacterium sp. OR-4]